MKVIADIVAKNQASIDKAYAEGLYIAGQRFVLTRVDEGDLYARAVRPRSRTASFTRLFYILAHTSAGSVTNNIW